MINVAGFAQYSDDSDGSIQALLLKDQVCEGGEYLPLTKEEYLHLGGKENEVEIDAICNFIRSTRPTIFVLMHKLPVSEDMEMSTVFSNGKVVNTYVDVDDD